MRSPIAAHGATPAAAEENVWLRRYAEVPAPAHRLVCFPHAGGAASAYLPFARRLAEAGIEGYAVQYPGRQDRRHEPFATTVGELAEGVLPELLRVLEAADGIPLSLFGHSMGATTAYEVARLLHHTGAARPEHLLVSGRRGPTVERRDTVHLLGDRELIEEVRKLQGTDPSVFADEELLRMVLPVLRADYLVAGRYRHAPGPCLDLSLTVLTGDADPNVGLSEARAWREVTTADTALHVFPGGHFYLQDQREAVCRTIEETLSDGNNRAR
ncbi:thioesterase II family protein [Nocardiopsis lucentensis]|uniref:thioesterase II family protein n=1 Tax=Nocardiopsis lucentensis TaxID=53441 RepID=UPI000345DDBA|nr:alpha/beta fold hydrolase [Nocardiopsis lucentensis]